ncbi:MAG TPA: hypothetical protein VFV99_01365 [Kofleriaceae bacterium]|nr:hypothetical protein [Kofleriaceae bacterium]
MLRTVTVAVAVAVALAGCGFSHGTLLDDAAPGGDAIDAPIDTIDSTTQNATCFDKWFAGTIRFATPAPISAINSPVYDRDPFLPADELAVFLSSQRGGGEDDIYVATRATVGDSFSTPMPAYEFNSNDIEGRFSIAANNKIAVVASNRPGGAGGMDVWESIRLNTTDQWPAMNRTNVMMVDTTGNDHDPTLSADGQHLYVAPDTSGTQHIVVATRGTNGKFGTPAPIIQLATTGGEADPWPTADERIIVYSSTAPTTGAGGGDIWYATRASATDTFGTPHIVPDINTTGAEGDPQLSSDGCRIYFSHLVSGTNWDIYIASALP